MITVTITVKEGSEKIGVKWVVEGEKTATPLEKEEILMIQQAIRMVMQFYEDKETEGYKSAFGSGDAAKKIVEKRFEDL